MSPDNERVEKGREILKSRAAQGEPGTKQPTHASATVSAEDTVRELETIQKKFGAPTRGPSAGETQNHPVPPAERSAGPAPADLNAAASAAAAIGTARAQIENQLVTEARLASDPRRERDQKVYEMGQRGELAFVPPAPEEVAAQAARSGLEPEVIEELPQTPSEQAARDEVRLEQGEQAAKNAKEGLILGMERADHGQVKPGEQEADAQPREPQPETVDENANKHVIR